MLSLLRIVLLCAQCVWLGLELPGFLGPGVWFLIAPSLVQLWVAPESSLAPLSL